MTERQEEREREIETEREKKTETFDLKKKLLFQHSVMC